MDQPEILSTDDPRLPDVLALIQSCFAYMDGQIDPPSSILAFDLDAVVRHAKAGELVVIGSQPQAAMVMAAQPPTLYLGKIAVALEIRGNGLARRLVAFAGEIAQTRGLTSLTLQSRVELTENHATFRALGFRETARTKHPGFDKPTSITFTKPV